MDLKSKIPNLQENVLMSNHTTFRIGGPARYFLVAGSPEELLVAVRSAREEGVPFFVFGGGSNLLVADRGFDGLIIKIRLDDFKVEGNKILAQAGVFLSRLVAESVDHRLNGLEWAAGIPGTIGGAIYGNSGAYGHSISELVETVEVISWNNFEAKEYSRKDCEFVYRGSRFKNKKTDEVIIGVTLHLAAGDQQESREKIKSVIAQRKGKIPVYPSAGSFFTNYRVQKNIDNDPLIKKFPELKENIRGGKIAAGLMIEQCGLKGKQIGGAMIANEHANFIVNLGGATSADVLELIKICREKVGEKFGVELKTEKILVGFD